MIRRPRQKLHTLTIGVEAVRPAEVWWKAKEKDKWECGLINLMEYK